MKLCELGGVCVQCASHPVRNCEAAIFDLTASGGEPLLRIAQGERLTPAEFAPLAAQATHVATTDQILGLSVEEAAKLVILAAGQLSSNQLLS